MTTSDMLPGNQIGTTSIKEQFTFFCAAQHISIGYLKKSPTLVLTFSKESLRPMAKQTIKTSVPGYEKLRRCSKPSWPAVSTKLNKNGAPFIWTGTV